MVTGGAAIDHRRLWPPLLRATFVLALLIAAPAAGQVDDCSDAPVGAACVDLPCTMHGHCDDEGFCDPDNVSQPGSSVTCDDFDECTTNDRCNGQGDCVGQNRPTGTACGDACEPGHCGLDEDGFFDCLPGTPRPAGTPCDDDDPCTTSDVCDENGFCLGTPRVCSDANACTDGDYCNEAGQCVGGTTLSCDDANTCTLDSCDPTAGCVHRFDMRCITPILALLDDPPCESTGVMVTSTAVRRSGSGPWDIKLRLTLRTTTLFDPARTDTTRLVVADSAGRTLWDSGTIAPGGAAWWAAATRRRYTFKDRTGSLANGLTALTIRELSGGGAYDVSAKIRVAALAAPLPAQGTHVIRVELSGDCRSGAAAQCVKRPNNERCK